MEYVFIDSIQHIVKLLVNHEYEIIQKDTSAKNMTTEQMQLAIITYGRTLIIPPDHAYNNIDVIEIHDASMPEWSVYFRLWTQEEGESDLTLELLIRKEDNAYCIQIDDIHIL